MLRAGLVVTVGIGLLTLAGVVGWRWREKTRGMKHIDEARQSFESGDYKSAKAAIDEVLNGSSRPEVVQAAMNLLDKIDSHVTDSTRSKRSEKEEAFSKQLAAIQDEAARLSYDTALSACAKLLQTDLEPYLVERVDARLQMIKQSFLDCVTRSKECARNYHEPERDEEVPAAYKRMTAAFPVELIALLPNVRAVAFDSAQKLKSPAREWMLEVLTAVDSFELVLARVKPALESLRERNLRLTTLQQLSEDYLEAVRAAESGNVERSRELLRKVRDQYGQGALRATFDQKLQRLDAAATCIQQIEEHLQKKEYAAAHDTALLVAQEYRDLQIPSTLGIPVMIYTIPGGAQVVVDGKEAGVAPLLLRLPLGAKANVRALLDHYVTSEVTVDPSTAAQQTVELERTRVAEVELAAKLLAMPIWFEDRLCAAGRDGNLYAVDFEKDQKPHVRSLKTGSISGSLAPPVGVKNGFVAAVFEGKVIRVDASGKELVAAWTADLKDEMKSPLFVVGETVLATTDSGRVVGLALADGTPSFEVSLNGRRVVGAPVWTGSRLVLPLAGGALGVVDPAARVLETVQETGADLVGALATDGTVVVGTSSTGKLLAFDAKSLALRASVDLDDLPADPPRVAWPRADVVLRRGLVVVDLAGEKIVRTVESTPAAASTPVVLDGLLFVGDEKGLLTVYDPDGNEPRLRAHLATTATVGTPFTTPLGWAVCARDGTIAILQR
jgi:outer membrane protein assembly factor BamB